MMMYVKVSMRKRGGRYCGFIMKNETEYFDNMDELNTFLEHPNQTFIRLKYYQSAARKYVYQLIRVEDIEGISPTYENGYGRAGYKMFHWHI